MYLTVLKWVGIIGVCLSLVFGIYKLGYNAGNDSSDADSLREANKELQEDVAKEKVKNTRLVTKLNDAKLVQEKNLAEVKELKEQQSATDKALNDLIKESNNACVNDSIPDVIFDSL